MVDPARALASWTELETCLANVFEIAIRGEQWLGIVHRSRRPGVEPVKVKVEATVALERSHVAITAPVFALAMLPPTTALAINHALELGALELEGTQYMLRATLPLAGLEAATLRATILHVARQAMHMVGMTSVPAQAVEAFVHYAE